MNTKPDTIAIVTQARRPKGVGRWARAGRVIVRDPWALLALVVLTIIVLAVIFAPLIAPADPDAQNSDGMLLPSMEHWLGTDDRGRDVLSRLLYGGRVSLGVSVSVVALAALVAVPLGLIAGYRRGKTDFVLMRLAEIGLAVPPLVLAIAVASILGAGAVNTTLALTIVFVPGLMRLVRGQSLAVSAETFVEASRAIGSSDWRILSTRILPSTASPLVVQATVMLSGALLAEAASSFLGLGTRPPTASWGNMLRSAYDAALFTNPWLVLIPGLAIAITVLAINKLGDTLRLALGLSRDVPHGSKRGLLGLTTVRRPKQATSGDATELTSAPRSPSKASPESSGPVLEIDDLTIELDGRTPTKVVEALNLTVGRGEIVGLVGESGAGKSVTAMVVMRLLAAPMVVTRGRVRVNGVDVLGKSRGEMRKLRGAEVAMIFQDPMTSLDPAFTVGHHLKEAIGSHERAGRAEVRRRSVELLELVGITDPERRLKAYPHELSGGMRQRVMIAIALSSRPQLLIADEPTTALDVTVQAQILDLLKSLVRELDMSMLIVSHDLGVIADVCDRVAVMYAGQLVEETEVFSLFASPQHPYTEGLLRSMPRLEQTSLRLRVIPGVVPSLTELPHGCRFAARCNYRVEACEAAPVPLEPRRDGGEVRCLRSAELTLAGADAIDELPTIPVGK